MNVIVFGSTGTVGKHLIEQSLGKGHNVTAFCRDPNKVTNSQHPNLSVITGDVFNFNDVVKAIKEQEIVFIALGSGKNRTSVVRSQGTKNIIDAMKLVGVKRLICQTTLGAGDSKGNLNFFWKNIMFGWFLKKVYLDHELQEEYVMKSKLYWTIVRTSAFTDGEKTSKYRHGFGPDDKSLKLKISRADVADFILEQLNSDRYLRKTPGLSY
jgi:putative NADH-flavin reductase